jgi:alanine-glyoxylate transaminase / serine-glyoxylate transaminase / serine-pyruvate transaminase
MESPMAPDTLAHTTNRPLKRGRKFLNTPGPTNVPPRVLNAMHRDTMDLNDPEFLDAAIECFEGLKRVFRTDGEVFSYISNGHGAWEAALVNTLEPGDLALVPETGHFSSSWADMAKALGIETQSVPGDWRRAHDPEKIAQALADDTGHRIKAVLLVQTDTATGITTDVKAVREAMNRAKHPALLIVDTIASLGTIDFRMDEWGVDVTIAASQKGLMMVPGLGFVAANDKAIAAHKATKRDRRYWDWTPRMSNQGYRTFCGTAPQIHIFGQREGLAALFEEGMERVFERHRVLAEATWKAIDVWGQAGSLEINALVEAERSLGVTTIRTAEGVNADRIREVCRDEMLAGVGGGLGVFGGRAFRIGHMGDMNAPMLYACLAAVEATFVYLDVPHTPGGVTAAVKHIAEYKKLHSSTTF